VIRKGQAAMEYLMTYGWALLIIIVVTAIFVGLIMNLQAPERCDFTTPGLICNNPLPVIAGDNINVRLGNGMQRKINVTGIGCYPDVSAGASDAETAGAIKDVTNVVISSGGWENFQNIQCEGADDVNPGETYTGKLFIRYNFGATDVVANRYADATIVLKQTA